MPKHNNRGMSRRNLLKGAGAGALGFGLLKLPVGTARAQISPTTADVTGYYRFTLGDFEMVVISDATFQLNATIFGTNQPAEDMQAFFENLNLLRGGESVPADVLNLVLMSEADNRIAVFDTGNGVGAGKLTTTLQALGIGTEDVTDVLMSHWHGDHINGLSNEGSLTFPNATVHFPQPEFEFLENGPQDMLASAKAKLQPAIDAEQVVYYNDGDEIISGVQAVYTPGHTPGHMSFLVQSGDNQLLHFVDSVLNAFSAPENPDWFVQFDADPEQAVESRMMILERAASENLQVMGYHFPFPGIGYVVNDGEDAWRFIPAAF